MTNISASSVLMSDGTSGTGAAVISTVMTLRTTTEGRPIVVQAAGALPGALVYHHDLRRLDRILRTREIANGADATAGLLQQRAR